MGEFSYRILEETLENCYKYGEEQSKKLERDFSLTEWLKTYKLEEPLKQEELRRVILPLNSERYQCSATDISRNLSPPHCSGIPTEKSQTLRHSS